MSLPVPLPDELSETMTALQVAEPPETMLFDRYRVVRELGRGGMGVVLLAHDQVLDIQVALKLVPDTVVRDSEGIIDLKKEVLRGMELTHPGIVRVFSLERDATTAAIVMEYIDGCSLAQRKALRPDRCFDPEEVQPWLEQICAALDYAHTEARIAHRDLKPGNLMLTTSGRLKIADFGIASGLSETMSRISVRSDASGTPAYMSPQQARGERPTHLDDIYALGATLYDLLTGKPPFFRGQILAQLLQERPVPMSERRAEFGITDRVPIPDAWEKAIGACLAKDPENRPASGAALLDLLKNPERALALQRAATVRDCPVEVVRTADVPAAMRTAALVPVQPQPLAACQPVRPVRWNPGPLVETTQAVLGTVFNGLGIILGRILAIALVIAALWIILVIKDRWDRGAAERTAAEAKARALAAAEAEPVRAPFMPAQPQAQPQAPTFQPPPFMPPPPPPGGGRGPAPGPGRR